MDRDETINFKIQKIYNDLQLLKDRHVYELDSVPGIPKCETLATRMEENMNAVVSELDKLSTSNITDEEQLLGIDR